MREMLREFGVDTAGLSSSAIRNRALRIRKEHGLKIRHIPGTQGLRYDLSDVRAKVLQQPEAKAA